VSILGTVADELTAGSEEELNVDLSPTLMANSSDDESTEGLASKWKFWQHEGGGLDFIW